MKLGRNAILLAIYMLIFFYMAIVLLVKEKANKRIKVCMPKAGIYIKKKVQNTPMPDSD